MNNNELKKTRSFRWNQQKKILNLCGIQTHKLQFRSPHANLLSYLQAMLTLFNESALYVDIPISIYL